MELEKFELSKEIQEYLQQNNIPEECYFAVATFIMSQDEISKEEIKPEASLTSDLPLDSLDMMGIVVELERHYEIEITDEAYEKWFSVGDILQYLAKELAEKKLK